MRSFLVLFSLPVVAFASPHFARSRPYTPRHASRNGGYQLKDFYQGNDFLDESKWAFFDQDDPTHGMVQYLNAADAKSNNLSYVQDDGTTVLAVDDTTQLSPGANRKSVRIASKNTYDNGLFIADIFAMPHGCSVWPAYWTVGPNWPNGGEIDVLEGVHEETVNHYTLHTSDGCTLSQDADRSLFTAQIGGTTCRSANGDNSGCGFSDTDTRTYGHGFNMIAGGVYAHTVDDQGISIWFFPRTEIPQDIDDKQPDPSTWGTPSAFFSSSTCDIASHFFEQSITFDTTLCGDLGAATFSSAGCSGTCGEAVADPENFKFAKWKINYVAVYQQ